MNADVMGQVRAAPAGLAGCDVVGFGGIRKGRPDTAELETARAFADGLCDS